MQSGKSAMESVKDKASNTAASARSGMEKTKATMQEKAKKMTSHSPAEKDMAERRKEERKAEAEMNKREAHEQTAAQKQANTASARTNYPPGEPGYTTGPHAMSAVPGDGTGQPCGRTVEGTAESHPIGTNTGTGRPNPGHNTRVGGHTGFGTGGYTG
ncbi:hypothetical protein Ancab_013748 [Ancistrocladus abbreviatus]